MQRKLKSLLRKGAHRRDAEGADSKYANSPTVNSPLRAPYRREYGEPTPPSPRSSVSHDLEQSHGPTRSGNRAVNGNAQKEVPLPRKEGKCNTLAKPPDTAAAPKSPSPVQTRSPVATSSDALAAEEVLDLKNSEDTDVTTEWAPAVTHEHIKPTTTEIRQPVIYREIHNHDVYPLIQPVLQTEILPARHFVPDPQDAEGKRLVEVPDEQVPEEWRRREMERRLNGGVGERVEPAAASAREKEDTASRRGRPSTTTITPRVIDEKKFTTSEGVERKETTVVHPAKLADMSAYSGPRETVHFYDKRTEKGEEEEQAEQEMKSRLDNGLNYAPDVLPLTLKVVTTSLAAVESAEEHRHPISKKNPRGRDSGIGVCSPGGVNVHDFGDRGVKKTSLELRGRESEEHVSAERDAEGEDSGTKKSKLHPPAPAHAPMVPSISVQPPPGTETETDGEDAFVDAVETLDLGTERWFPLNSAAAAPS